MSFEYGIVQTRLHRHIKSLYVLVILLHISSLLCIANGAAEQDHSENGGLELIREESHTPDIFLNFKEALFFDENSDQQNSTEFIAVESPNALGESNHNLRVSDGFVIDDNDSVSTKQTSEGIQVIEIPANSDIKDGEVDAIDVETKQIVEQQHSYERSEGLSNVGDFDIRDNLDNPILNDPEKLNLENSSSSHDGLVTVSDSSADLSTSHAEAEVEDRTNIYDGHTTQSTTLPGGGKKSKSVIENIPDNYRVCTKGQGIAGLSIDINGDSATDAGGEFDVAEGTAYRTLPDGDDSTDDGDSVSEDEINGDSEDNSENSSGSSTGSGSGSDTVLSRSLDSRIRRLTALVEDRRDLIENYNTQQMEDETIMNSVNRHIMAALQHRPLVPLSDSTCYWSYVRER
jgi:hypothetical protein